MIKTTVAHVASPDHAPLTWAATRISEYQQGITERRSADELAEDMAREEERMGREMSPREAMAFSVGFLSPGYSFALYEDAPDV